MKYKILDITAVNMIQGKTKQTDNEINEPRGSNSSKKNYITSVFINVKLNFKLCFNDLLCT